MSKDLKRKRGLGSKASLKRGKVSHPQNLKTTGRKTIKSDALSWKESLIPDRLDDAEGFYGLEEIDDVEVVKDDATGQISFRVGIDESLKAEDLVTEESEEWNGFHDKTSPDIGTKVLDPVIYHEGTSSSHIGESIIKPSKIIRTAKFAQPTAINNLDNVRQNLRFDVLADEVDDNQSIDMTAWEALDLSQDLLAAISSLGFEQPTPIQKGAIIPACQGCDVIGKAVTGSGKTLAFGIPIVEWWLKHKIDTSLSSLKAPIALILAPTRELAHQLRTHLTNLCQGLKQAPRIVTVTGGLSVIKQQRQLGIADIVIGTPGRLWDVINDSHGLIDQLKLVQFLVIDEADRLLGDGHFKEVEEILSILDKKVTDENGEDISNHQTPRRQTLVFSATFHKGLQQKLASKQKWKPNNVELLSNTQSLDYLLQKLKFQSDTKPTFVDANPETQIAEKVTESILECGAMQKDLYLYSTLLFHQHEHMKLLRLANGTAKGKKLSRTLVFTNSISTVKRLVPLLTSLAIPSTSILPLHSGMPQKSRLRSLERFSTPIDQQVTTIVLIATDVAARGLDIKDIDTVIHYHVPRAADSYVHRSGRTARSTNSGSSILICSPEEVASVTRLISKVHSGQMKGKGPSQTSNKSGPLKNAIQPLYLPAGLPQQLQNRVNLGQKITNANLDTSKTNSDSHFLRTAAEELGVDYDSEEFDEISVKNRRGRGGGRDQKRRENVSDKSNGKVETWKAELKADLKGRSVDFGDGEAVTRGGRFLAGGGIDVERLLMQRG